MGSGLTGLFGTHSEHSCVFAAQMAPSIALGIRKSTKPYIKREKSTPHLEDGLRVSLRATLILPYYLSQTYVTGIYQMRCTAYKVAPDDGLIQSETCRAYIENKV